MTTKYKYKGQFVELVPGQQFSSHWNVYYNEPTAEGGSIRRIVTVIPGQTLEIIDDAKEEASPIKHQEINENFNINSATFTSIKSKFSGIGRVASKAIITHRPEGGYRDFDELKELNKELTINWDELKDKLEF